MDYHKELSLHRQLLLSSLKNYTKKMFAYINGRPFVIGDHHLLIFDALQKVVRGETQKLIINIAPRYGKTEIASKMFISYGLALNPAAKFLHLSYSWRLVQDNSLYVQDTMNSTYYQALFPYVQPKLGKQSRVMWATTAGGGEYATSTLGQITGFGAGAPDYTEEEIKNLDYFTATYNPGLFSGCIIIDDPIRPEDALLDSTRESVNRRFETTIRNRVNSRNTPIVIIMQRLHEHDLCGYLMEVEPDEWTVLSIPCIQKDENGNDFAIWPYKQNLEELYHLREVSNFVFETQYMQNPTPLEGFMYRPFKLYDIIPETKNALVGNYTDSADTGSDWLCSINFIATKSAYYVTDVLYTKKPMEYTEPALAEMLNRGDIEVAFIEGNNGGRGFARNVERLLRSEHENRKTRFITFTQSQNKLVRIFTHSNEVNNMLVFPNDWERRWPEFARDLIAFRKEGVNAHDDAPDACTGIIEKCASYLGSVSEDDILNDFL